jgi:hypothetical protein
VETLPPLLAQALETDNSVSERSDLRRLQRQFFVSFVSVVAATLVLLGLYAVHHWRNQQQLLNHRLAFNTQLLAGATIGRLQQYALLSNDLAMSIQRDPQLLKDAPALQLRLRQAESALEGIAVIRVVSANGQILGSTARLGPSFELRNNPLIWAHASCAAEQAIVVGPLVACPH